MSTYVHPLIWVYTLFMNSATGHILLSVMSTWRSTSGITNSPTVSDVGAPWTKAPMS